MRRSLVGPHGEVVGRSDEETYEGIPVPRGALVVGVRLGDWAVEPDGSAGPRPPVLALTAQAFAAPGTLRITEHWSDT